MGHRFQLRHMREHRQLPNLWLVMNGCMKAHESSVSIIRHMREHRQFGESLACHERVHGST